MPAQSTPQLREATTKAATESYANRDKIGAVDLPGDFSGKTYEEVSLILQDRVKKGQVSAAEAFGPDGMLVKYTKAYNPDGSPKAKPPTYGAAQGADPMQEPYGKQQEDSDTPVDPNDPDMTHAKLTQTPVLDKEKLGIPAPKPTPKPAAKAAPKTAQSEGWSGKQLGENVKTVPDENGWEYQQMFDATTGKVTYRITKAPEKNKGAIGMVLEEGDKFYNDIDKHALAVVGDPRKSKEPAKPDTDAMTDQITASRPKTEVRTGPSDVATSKPMPDTELSPWGVDKNAPTLPAGKATQDTATPERPKTLRERTSEAVASVMKKREEGDSASAGRR